MSFNFFCWPKQICLKCCGFNDLRKVSTMLAHFFPKFGTEKKFTPTPLKLVFESFKHYKVVLNHLKIFFPILNPLRVDFHLTGNYLSIKYFPKVLPITWSNCTFKFQERFVTTKHWHYSFHLKFNSASFWMKSNGSTFFLSFFQTCLFNIYHLQMTHFST